MIPLISPVLHQPLFLLYGCQAATYLVASRAAQRHGHRDMACCYGFSALLHGLFAAAHLAGH